MKRPPCLGKIFSASSIAPPQAGDKREKAENSPKFSRKALDKPDK